MILHTVLFRLSRPVDEEVRTRFLAGLRSFAATAPHSAGPAVVLADLELREENPRVADAALQATFPDDTAFRAYLAAPEHVALVQQVLTPHCEGWWSIQSAPTTA